MPVFVGLLSLLLAILSFSTFAFPESVSASTMTLAARCDGVALRTSASTSATLKTRIPSGTKVVAYATVTGGNWTTVCAGVTKSGSTWYRIVSIAGKSVKSLYGVSYLYGATSLFKTISVITTLYAQCTNTPARTTSSTTGVLKVKLALGEKVASNGTVTGGTWTSKCPSVGTGTTWYRVFSVNGTSVSSLYGVSYLYVPKVELATTAPSVTAAPTPTPKPTATPTPKPSATATPKPSTSASASVSPSVAPSPTPTPTPKPTPTPTPTPIPIGTPLPSQPNACKPPPSPTPTPVPTATPTPNPSASATPAPSPTATPAPTPQGGWNCVAGLDVSKWQGTINWTKVAQSGYKFAYMKATEGGNYTDPTYATNRAGANANGLIIGAYDFAQPSLTPGQAEAEADYFVKVASPKSGDLTPILDLETRNNLTTAQLQDWVRRWMYRVYLRTGVRAAIYVSPSFWSTYMGNTTWFANNGFRVLWIAHWTSGTSPTVPASNWGNYGWSFWQWTSSGTVPGISGRVDLDRFHYAKLAYYRIP